MSPSLSGHRRGAGGAGSGGRTGSGVARNNPIRVSGAPQPASLRNLSARNLTAFFNALPRTSFWYPYFFIQYAFGCRLSEPALLLDNDVRSGLGTTPGQETIIIKRIKRAQRGEGFSAVEHDADSKILACVKAAQLWKQNNKRTDNPFLFASSRQRETEEVGAERLSQLRNADGWQSVSRFTAHRNFQSIAARAKLPADLRHNQVLRHTRAVVLLACGIAAAKVQFVLGHSSIHMTNRYLRAAEEFDIMAVREDLGL